MLRYIIFYFPWAQVIYFVNSRIILILIWLNFRIVLKITIINLSEFETSWLMFKWSSIFPQSFYRVWCTRVNSPWLMNLWKIYIKNCILNTWVNFLTEWKKFSNCLFFIVVIVAVIVRILNNSKLWFIKIALFVHNFAFGDRIFRCEVSSIDLNIWLEIKKKRSFLTSTKYSW